MWQRGHGIHDEDLRGVAEVHGSHWPDENAENSESMEFKLRMEKPKSKLHLITKRVSYDGQKQNPGEHHKRRYLARAIVECTRACT